MKQGSNILLKNTAFLYLKGEERSTSVRLRRRAGTQALSVISLAPCGGHLVVYLIAFTGFGLLVFKIKGNVLLGLFPTNLSPVSCLHGCF